jgi:hypothetical protein
VLVDLTSQVTLDPVVGSDPVTDPNDLFIGQVAHVGGGVHLSADTGLASLRRSDPIDVRESDLQTLVAWEINT